MKNAKTGNNYVTKSEFRKAIDEINETLRIIKTSVLNMERRMTYYSDMFEINKGSDTKLAKRVNIIEKHVGITTNDDLLVSGY